MDQTSSEEITVSLDYAVNKDYNHCKQCGDYNVDI